MTPLWETIESELEKHRDARETIIEVRKRAADGNFLKVSLDHQMEEARKLLELADQLILTAFRHFGGDQLTQWRERYAKFIEDTREETNNV